MRQSGDFPDLECQCPNCGSGLVSLDPDTKSCPSEDLTYRRQQGIWRFLTPARAAYYDRFLHDYLTVRKAEGRGSHDPQYYRSLPFRDLSGRFIREWRIRARTYETFVREVLAKQEGAGRRLEVLDLGAGNCWFSHRIATRGHSLTAVDLLVDVEDGLGAHAHYETSFRIVQAEFDRLPFACGQFDLVVFNGSLHYSPNFEITLGAAVRQLRPDGLLVIMDSPIYHDPDSGARMLEERARLFSRKYGFASDSLSSQGFLTYHQIERLACGLGLRWKLVRPRYGVSWALRPVWARFLGRREPATFLLLIGAR